MYYDAAKRYIEKNGISYITKDKSQYTLITDDLHGITFPQIYVNGNDHIGGYTELVQWSKPSFDYQKLKELSKTLTYNLNKIIDYNFYPIPETERSNRRHRPIGLGVQGLANVFYEMKTEFGYEESKEIES